MNIYSYINLGRMHNQLQLFSLGFGEKWGIYMESTVPELKDTIIRVFEEIEPLLCQNVIQNTKGWRSLKL